MKFYKPGTRKKITALNKMKNLEKLNMHQSCKERSERKDLTIKRVDNMKALGELDVVVAQVDEA